jgi:ribosomal protein S12 methylthiotransferase
VCEGVGRYWLQTLGCPKNQVDSDKLEGHLARRGYDRAADPAGADLVVVNTCAFIEAARQESIDTVLDLSDRRANGARLVVTGCMAERYGEELRDALPEVDLVAGFGRDLIGDDEAPDLRSSAVTAAVPVSITTRLTGRAPVGERPHVPQNSKHLGLQFWETHALRRGPPHADRRSVHGAYQSYESHEHESHKHVLHEHESENEGERAAPAAGFDLLELPRPPARAPWAYVKVAEGCDRICGFCAIPSFRGKQRSRPIDDVLAEVDALVSSGRPPALHHLRRTPDQDPVPPLREVVLVAQDLASYGRDRSIPGRRLTNGRSPIAALTRAVATKVERTRLLYLYPSGLTDELVDAVLATGVPYFDLSLQHVSRPLLARMRRWGEGDRFLRRIADIRAADPAATFRSSFILGYPGETERDHDLLLQFLSDAQLDWAGFFTFSREDGTHAAGLPDQVPSELALERLRECAELQDAITAARRDRLIGAVRRVLVDRPGQGRTVHEAPEIDGVVHLPPGHRVGELVDVRITHAVGPDLHAVASRDRQPAAAGALPP